MLDLDAYLERIGLRGRPSIAEVHRAHVTTIPFENLDPHRGVPVSLAPEDLHKKLVAERRGGYCFEHNMLLKSALEALGAEVDVFLARVRAGAPPGTIRPRSHLVLRVRADGKSWHADVGFGLGSLLEPLPFGPGEEHEQAGWRFRVVRDGPELVLQSAAQDDAWNDVYGFLPYPLPLVDVEVSNWWVSTHPRSPFVTGLIVCSQATDGTRLAMSNRDGLNLTEQTPAGSTVTPLAHEEIPGVLAERFGLEGFTMAGEGRLTLAA
ncbi:MAG TPA: arylamine N-acetyltransferase [Solirubrobacteraceae bacterium]|jgi:N-hydroxyarylamine O-acetyltransferase